MYSSASRVKNANLLWEMNNSTYDRPPILKKYKSNNTSQKKEDSKVRFRRFNKDESDDELIPQRLDFADTSYEKVEYGPIRRGEYAERRLNVDRNWKIMKNVEKEGGYFDKLFGNSNKFSDFEDPFDFNRSNSDKPQVLDLRNIEHEKSSKHSKNSSKDRLGLKRH